MASELGKRVAVAAVGIPLIVLLMYAGGLLLGAALAGAAAIAALELYRLAQLRGARPFRAIGAAGAAAIVLWASWRPEVGMAAPLLWWLAFLLVLVSLTVSIWQRGPDGAPLGAAAITVFGSFWLGGGLACAVFLRALPGPNADPWLGAAMVAFPFTLAWWGDTCAYFAGRAWGRHKLIPTVSPGKTVEGAIANVAGTALIGAVYAWLVFDAWLGLPFPVLAGAVAGLLVSPAAQVGDLAESLIKREARVKDSGTLFPGHGGVLDRIDSLLFAVPVALLYVVAVLPLWVEGLPWR